MTVTYAPGQSPDDVRRALEAMAARIRDMRPVLVPGAEMLRGVLERGFETSTAPDGTPWAPNAQSTIDKKRGSAKPNVDTSRLKRGTQVRAVGTNSIQIGSNVPYAGPVQFGSTRSGMTIDPAIARKKNAPRAAIKAKTRRAVKAGKKMNRDDKRAAKRAAAGLAPVKQRKPRATGVTRIGGGAPRKTAAPFVSKPWKVTIPARPFLPYSPTGGLTSSGPAGEALKALSRSVVEYIVSGRVT